MKVLMLGWELPPVYAGGIGMVCYDLLKELSSQDVDVTYLMPFGPKDFSSDTRAKVVVAENVMPTIKGVTIKQVESSIAAYESPAEYEKNFTQYQSKLENVAGKKRKTLYGPDLYTEVDLFAKRAYALTSHMDFDVIHAHDWQTFPAAIGLSDASGKPFVVHVHNTIYDRYLGNASQHERDIELNGILRANKVIAISQYIKNSLINNYGVDPNKIEVVHNAPNTLLRDRPKSEYKAIDLHDDKVVLFTGRVTIQKGPEYFVQCAKEVLAHEPKAKFVMAGTGDMFHRVVNLANELGIGHKFLFTGFYTMDQAQALYSRADCFVMPSVSEPFGIVPLEAMDFGAPTIVSRSSGCSEVLTHALKTDFWDIKQMASKVISVLRYPALAQTLSENGQRQVRDMNWSTPTKKCIDIYKSVQ